MNDTDIENTGPKDTTRNVIAWIVLIISSSILFWARPEVNVYESAMYLPLITDRPAIGNKQVSVVRDNSYFFYKKIGYITITTPDIDDNSSTRMKTIEQAKSMAAEAGADALYVEGMRSSTWFDSGKKIFRLQAVAMSQS